MKALRDERGFTLIELLIVITIIAILSVVVVPRFMDIPQKAKVE
ncbi:MAG TPA: type II secretion system protein, partial [Spirochaetota bacterium]|nr:type II secretion system protein [Spirochaetota bacterium]